MTDVPTTKRKSLSPMQRLKLFEDHGGICVVCERKIDAGEPWIDEHLRALGLGGSNDLDNRGPAHAHCADTKTRTEDIPRIAKAKRQKAKHLGIPTRKGRPLPGTKASGWKHNMDGSWERRS